MAINIDNALAETCDALHYTATYVEILEPEHTWVVNFRNKHDEKVQVEILIRDGGLVMSVLSVHDVNHRDLQTLMDMFSDKLNIIPV